MAKTVSYTSFDYKPVEIVPVIASFDSDGNIAPLFVRINGESYKIDSYWTSSSFRNTIEFRCKVICKEYIRPLSLTYYKEENMWVVPKDKR